MKSLKFIAILFASSVILNACKKDDPKDDQIDPSVKATLSGDITENKTFTSNDTVLLPAFAYVKSGITIRFEAGTIIKGSGKGALIIEQGAKLICNGTQEKPVVFTSAQEAGQRQPGDWGGVVLLGKAPTNRSTPPLAEGAINRSYGGNDPQDNSGSLKYVRIEYAGVVAEQNSEINGLTCYGVGNGTVLENIMVSYGNDDAYEFFGGTVNAKNLIAFATGDDDYDFDFGYVGKIQYAIALRDPSKADAADPSNGIECDNDKDGTLAEPFTRPNLSNFTLIGPNGAANTLPNHAFAARFRRSARFSLRNSIILGHAQGGLALEKDITIQAYYTDKRSEFKNNIIQAVKLPYVILGSTIITDADLEVRAVTDGNTKFSTSTDAGLTNITNINAPNFMPSGISPAKTGANYDGLDDFFTKGTFRGAIGDNDWTKSWTNFNPQTTKY